MRPLVPLALLLAFSGLVSSVCSETYIGTFPPSHQPPTATGPTPLDDGESGTVRTAEQPATDKPAPEQPAAAQPPSQSSDEPASAPTTNESAAKSFDVKNNFRNICSFCHADYGRKAGRGPQLMDSPRSDEFLFGRIKHGVTGRMPGFGTTYSDAQIHQFVKFIRSLKVGEEPKNPA